MPTIQIETDQLLQAALQMPRPELESFVARLFTLKARQETPSLSQRETALLQQINHGLPPVAARRRKTLAAKRQVRTITEAELQELVGLNDEAERLNVERVKHLIELAALRNVTLDEVMEQLGLNHQQHG